METIKGMIAIGLGLFVFLFIIMRYVATNKHTKEYLFRKRAEENGNVALGHVHKVRRRFGNTEAPYGTYQHSSLAIVKYQYTVDGNAYYRTVRYYDDNPTVTDYPNTTNIYYNPRHPARSYAEYETDGKRSQALWMRAAIVLGIATVLGSYILMTKI